MERQIIILIVLSLGFTWEIVKRIIAYKAKSKVKTNINKQAKKGFQQWAENFIEKVFYGSGKFFAFIMPPLIAVGLVYFFEVIIDTVCGLTYNINSWMTITAAVISLGIYVLYEVRSYRKNKRFVLTL